MPVEVNAEFEKDVRQLSVRPVVIELAQAVRDFLGARDPVTRRIAQERARAFALSITWVMVPILRSEYKNADQAADAVFHRRGLGDKLLVAAEAAHYNDEGDPEIEEVLEQMVSDLRRGKDL